MMICVSTPGSLMLPSTSTTRPTGPRVAVGQRVISTTTMSSGSRRRRLARRDLHVRHDAAVERDHVTEAGRVGLEAADDRAVGTLEDADDAPFEPRSALRARRARGRDRRASLR